MSESPFLNKIIKQFLPKSISFGLLPLISDFARKHLYNDKDAKYIYNQPHIYMHNREEEGYDLPIYYHIQFIGILYATAIRNKVDIDIVSRNNKNMQSIYSGMIEGMIDNISVVTENDSTEYPTNYHWLIGEILSITNHWLDEFNEEENYVETSSYVDYITLNIGQCFSELYQGRKKNKFEIKFIVSLFYYRVLTSYFSQLLNDSLRNSIEENIIIKIQKDLVHPILKLSLDEKYAARTDEFYEGHYHVLNYEERKILNRFRNFLIDNKKI